MFNKIRKTEIPPASRCPGYLERIDYRDAFCAPLADGSRSVEDLYIALFAHSPAWVTVLLALRNKIAGFIGLDDYKDAAGISREELRAGARSGLFFIYAIDGDEVIAGGDDRHLNFRVTVMKRDGEVVIGTLVMYHNRLGRAYMSLIRPFHQMIVRAMLQKAVKEKRI